MTAFGLKAPPWMRFKVYMRNGFIHLYTLFNRRAVSPNLMPVSLIKAINRRISPSMCLHKSDIRNAQRASCQDNVS